MTHVLIQEITETRSLNMVEMLEKSLHHLEQRIFGWAEQIVTLTPPHLTIS